jgi:hypothetical protein
MNASEGVLMATKQKETAQVIILYCLLCVLVPLAIYRADWIARKLVELLDHLGFGI